MSKVSMSDLVILPGVNEQGKSRGKTKSYINPKREGLPNYKIPLTSNLKRNHLFPVHPQSGHRDILFHPARKVQFHHFCHTIHINLVYQILCFIKNYPTDWSVYG